MEVVFRPASGRQPGPNQDRRFGLTDEEGKISVKLSGWRRVIYARDPRQPTSRTRAIELTERDPADPHLLAFSPRQVVEGHADRPGRIVWMDPREPPTDGRCTIAGAQGRFRFFAPPGDLIGAGARVKEPTPHFRVVSRALGQGGEARANYDLRTPEGKLEILP